jgi:hypothetical protein
VLHQIPLVEELVEDVCFLQFNEIETHIFKGERDQGRFASRTDARNVFGYLK